MWVYDAAAQMRISGRPSRRSSFHLATGALVPGLGTAIVKARKMVRFALTEEEEKIARLASGSWTSRVEEVLRRVHLRLLVQVRHSRALRACYLGADAPADVHPLSQSHANRVDALGRVCVLATAHATLVPDLCALSCPYRYGADPRAG